MKVFTFAQSAQWLGTTQENLRRMIDNAEVQALCTDDGRLFLDSESLYAALVEYGDPARLHEFEFLIAN